MGFKPLQTEYTIYTIHFPNGITIKPMSIDDNYRFEIHPKYNSNIGKKDLYVKRTKIKKY